MAECGRQGDVNARLDVPDADTEPAGVVAESDAQINVPPTGRGRLWKVVALALRCPACTSTNHKAVTGKRLGAEGLMEHYRRCRACDIRFRVVFE
jgi:hypothetical protein